MFSWAKEVERDEKHFMCVLHPKAAFNSFARQLQDMASDKPARERILKIHAAAKISNRQ
jgi:hypothetical protein